MNLSLRSTTALALALGLTSAPAFAGMDEAKAFLDSEIAGMSVLDRAGQEEDEQDQRQGAAGQLGDAAAGPGDAAGPRPPLARRRLRRGLLAGRLGRRGGRLPGLGLGRLCGHRSGVDPGPA